MINKTQLKELIIIPSLEKLASYMHKPQILSDSAVNLLLGTAATESLLGTYIAQIKGPALGIYQMEPFTYRDIWATHISNNYELNSLFSMYNAYPNEADILVYNLRVATFMARLHYWRIPAALPDANDIEGLGEYWKKYYNTRLGKGTVEKFVQDYENYIIN